MAKTDFSSIDDYIASRPKPHRAVLERVRAIIKKALPKGAEEAISYQIPAFKLEGRVVIFFAGWKEHFSVYPATKLVTTTLKTELVAYEVSKGTIRFPIEEAIPTKLIARIAKLRAEEHLAHLAATGVKKKAAAVPRKKKATNNSTTPARTTPSNKKKRA